MLTYNIELYIKEAIAATAKSTLTITEKRNLIYSLFSLAAFSECGFINRDSLTELIECQYTFVFPKEEMYNYQQKQSFYDTLAQNQELINGDVYTPADNPDLICVDSGSDAWQAMVSLGKIHGEGTRPICVLAPITTLLTAKELIGKFSSMQVYRAHLKLLQLSNAVDDWTDDECLKEINMTRAEFEALLAE